MSKDNDQLCNTSPHSAQGPSTAPASQGKIIQLVIKLQDNSHLTLTQPHKEMDLRTDDGIFLSLLVDGGQTNHVLPALL